MIARTIRCAAALFTGITLSAQQLPTALLSLNPSQVLPGLPVAFLVTVNNPNKQPVTLLDAMELQVASAAGTFMATGIGGRSGVTLPPDAVTPCGSAKCFVIPGNGQKQLYVDYGGALAENEFFADERLNVPGVYSLQLVLYVDTSDGSKAPITSNPATLTVSVPSGVDADAWTFLRQQSPTHVWSLMQWATGGDAIATRIRSDFPTSAYVPWIAGYGRATEPSVTVKVIDTALAQNPPDSLRDNLLWMKGTLLEGWSDNALHAARNLDLALTYADQARTTLDTLKRVAIADVTKQKATATLAELYTNATARTSLDRMAAGDPPAPAQLVPHVDCVVLGSDSSFTAQFGYVNPNAANKVLQISDLNQVTPAPRDQDQPRIFRPGSHDHVFGATNPGGELKWHLDGNVATATRDFATPCSAP
ncbi:MAG TPA: hypothetical protein VGJ81_02720 [Thermoanaerobaculia bacterium]